MAYICVIEGLKETNLFIFFPSCYYFYMAVLTIACEAEIGKHIEVHPDNFYIAFGHGACQSAWRKPSA